MPSNRVSDCRASRATRNEDWPGSPPVNRNKGKRKMIMEIKCSQCGFTSNGPNNHIAQKLKCSNMRVTKQVLIGVIVLACALTLITAGCGKQNDVSLFGFHFSKAPSKEFVDNLCKDAETEIDDNGIVRLSQEFRYLMALPIDADERTAEKVTAKYNKDELAAMCESGWKVKVWLNSKDDYKLFRIKRRIKMEDSESTTAKFNEIREALGGRYGVPNRTVTKGNSKFCLWMVDGVNIVVTGNFKGYTSLYVFGGVAEDDESRKGLVEVFGEDVFSEQNGGTK